MVILVLAVEWNGDQLSPINVVGLLVCLSGIICHVIHKIQTTAKYSAKSYEIQAERHELGEHLMIEEHHYDIGSESDERSDTQILFEVIGRHER